VVQRKPREHHSTTTAIRDRRNYKLPAYQEDYEENFEIIGECYVDGLDNMSCLFGRLPDDWTSQFDKMKGGYGATHTYLRKDGKITKWHPLLEELPQEWIVFERERRLDDPSTFTCFRNVRTGEGRNSDPRLTATRLRARGIEIHSFVFV
jgi:hypothetical protein